MTYRNKCIFNLMIVFVFALFALFLSVKYLWDFKEDVHATKVKVSELENRISALGVPSVPVNTPNWVTDYKKDVSPILDNVDKSISELSSSVKVISDSVSKLDIKLNSTSVELKQNIEETKSDLLKKNAEIESAIVVVNKTVNNIIIELNGLKKITDEDRARVEVVIKYLLIVKDKVNGMQSQIDDLKLMFPDYEFLLKIRKAGIREFGGAIDGPVYKEKNNEMAK